MQEIPLDRDLNLNIIFFTSQENISSESFTRIPKDTRAGIHLIRDLNLSSIFFYRIPEEPFVSVISLRRIPKDTQGPARSHPGIHLSRDLLSVCLQFFFHCLRHNHHLFLGYPRIPEDSRGHTQEFISAVA